MKEQIKKFYKNYKSYFKGLFTALGFFAIFDWVIAPGLTASNTLINVLSFILAGVVSMVGGILIWNHITDEKDEENKEDNSGKIY